MIKNGFSIDAQDHRKFYVQLLARRDGAARDPSHETDYALAAKLAVPVMSRSFQRWAKLPRVVDGKTNVVHEWLDRHNARTQQGPETGSASEVPPADERCQDKMD